MSNFAELKSSRAQRIGRKFSSRQAKDASISDAQVDSGDEQELMLVDPADASETTSDIPKSPIRFRQSPSYESSEDPELRFSLPPGLEVRLTVTRGRGIWNQSQRRKGEILVGEVPTVATLSTRYLATHCSACFFEPGDKPLKRCPACQLIHYCDSECQTRDWPLHKRECPALQKWLAVAPQASPAPSDDPTPEALIPSDAIRALGRLLWGRQKKGRDSIWVKETDAMQSHRASLSRNEQTSQLHTHMAHALVRYLGLESLDELAAYYIDSIAALVDLVSRFTTNAFAVTSPTLTPIGVCVSPKVALFNHSCEPNAVLVFPGVPQNPKKEQPKLEVIAIKNIPPDEEISISYIDTTLPRHQRQEALKETYYFTCECPLCSRSREEGTDVDRREGIFCSRKCGGVCWLPTEEDSFTRCQKCKAVVKDTDAILDAVRIGQEALEKATRVQLSDPQKAIQLTQNLIPILTSAGLTLSSHPLLALSRLHTTLLITNLCSPFDPNSIELNSPQIQEQRQLGPETKSSHEEAQENLDETIRSATRTCNGLNQILPYGYPIRGLAVIELGKLLSVDEPAPKHLIDDAASPPPPIPATAPQFTSAVPALYPPSGPQRLKLAYETLVRAREELMVGFGSGKNEGGQVGLEARKLLADIEKELSVWREGIRSAIAGLPKTTSRR